MLEPGLHMGYWWLTGHNGPTHTMWNFEHNRIKKWWTNLWTILCLAETLQRKLLLGFSIRGEFIVLAFRSIQVLSFGFLGAIIFLCLWGPLHWLLGSTFAFAPWSRRRCCQTRDFICLGKWQTANGETCNCFLKLCYWHNLNTVQSAGKLLMRKWLCKTQPRSAQWLRWGSFVRLLCTLPSSKLQLCVRCHNFPRLIHWGSSTLLIHVTVLGQGGR